MNLLSMMASHPVHWTGNSEMSILNIRVAEQYSAKEFFCVGDMYDIRRTWRRAAGVACGRWLATAFTTELSGTRKPCA